MDASQSDIKKAYYSKAQKYHPDVNNEKNAHETFTQINAYLSQIYSNIIIIIIFSN